MKVAFFDLDGTIIAPWFLLDNEFVIGFPPEGWKKYCNSNPDSYRDCKIVPPIMDFAKHLKKQGWDLQILTIAISKNEMLIKEHFYNTTPEINSLFSKIHILSMDQIASSAKSSFIKVYLECNEVEDCMIVDDSLDMLYACSNLGIKLRHISHILTIWKEKNDTQEGSQNQRELTYDPSDWIVTKIDGRDPHMQIKKTFYRGSHKSKVNLVCNVYQDHEDDGPMVTLSCNGKIGLSKESWESFKNVVDATFNLSQGE